ncbi:hypothetical protein AURDEDRAFT_146372 [Auricularia subglabra TFB-10046 SS5]|nr:hypothetical protein AURDEDRAFT_146372 [Auricularia subglabra TFB-10046 SS5]
MALLSRARAIAGPLYDDGCCPFCLLDLAGDFVKDSAALDEARKDVHKLWDNCAWALNFPSMEEPLIELISDEHRSKAARALAACAHHATQVHSEDILQDFMGGVCACLHACLSRGESSAVQRSAKRKRPYENHGGYWPKHSMQLFPYDEQPGVQSVLFWCSKLESPWALHLLADILRIAHPLVFYEIMEAEGTLHRDLIITVVRRLAGFAQWMIRSGDDDPIPDPDPNEDLRATVSFLRSVNNSPDALPSALLMFADGLEGELFTALQLALRTIDRSEPICRSLILLCATLYHHIPTPDPNTLLCPDILPYTRVHETLSVHGVVHRALKILARNRRICSGPDCGTVAHQEPDEHFLVCGRCKLSRYCTKACQVADWRSGSQVPHKTICPLVCKLLSVAKVEMPRQEFESASSGLDWDVADLRALSLFTLNIRLLLLEVLIRAADVHRELLGEGEVPEQSSEALDYVDRMRQLADAKKAGVSPDDI